jgi:hypothetical protein
MFDRGAILSRREGLRHLWQPQRLHHIQIPLIGISAARFNGTTGNRNVFIYALSFVQTPRPRAIITVGDDELFEAKIAHVLEISLKFFAF